MFRNSTTNAHRSSAAETSQLSFYSQGRRTKASRCSLPLPWGRGRLKWNITASAERIGPEVWLHPIKWRTPSLLPSVDVVRGHCGETPRLWGTTRADITRISPHKPPHQGISCSYIERVFLCIQNLQGTFLLSCLRILFLGLNWLEKCIGITVFIMHQAQDSLKTSDCITCIYLLMLRGGRRKHPRSNKSKFQK